MSDVRLTGGCQCGAVRYVISGTPHQVGVCHCRMCQKAVGAPFFASFTVKKGEIEWTRGEPAVFKSSLKMERGFCRDCGTPLYNNWVANEVIHPAIATLDDPSSVRPEFQIGTESRLSWIGDIDRLKAMTTDDIFTGYEALLDEIKATNHQHPDHDTKAWPPDATSAT
jgi:hypothetical protein